MKNIVKLGSILFLICAIAALSLGFVNKITSPIIEKRGIDANNESRKIVLPDANEFKKLPPDVLTGIDGVENDMISEVYEGVNGSNLIGYTVKTLPKGYGGAIELMVGISKDGTLTGINIGSMSETPGLGSKAGEDGFKDQFKHKNAKEISVVKGKTSSEQEIEAISGATITSQAVTDGVNAAIKVFNEKLIK